MRAPFLSALLVAAASGLIAAACDPQVEELPTAAPSLGVTADADAIAEQIRVLFPDPGLKHAALQRLRNLERQLERGQLEAARDMMFELVDFTLMRLGEGQLADPPGSETTEEAVLTLIGALYDLVGLAAPTVSEAALEEDGAAQVVGPDGGLVVTETAKAGVLVPPGALEASVLLTIERLPDPVLPTTGPLPTTLPQYPLFYRFGAFPELRDVDPPLVVDVCQVEAGAFAPPAELHDEPIDDLVLLQQDPDDPRRVVVLERVDVPPFLICAGTVLGLEPSGGGWLRQLGRWAARWVRPRRLDASAAVVSHKGRASAINSIDPNSVLAGGDDTCVGEPVGSRIFQDSFDDKPVNSGASDWEPEVGGCWDASSIDLDANNVFVGEFAVAEEKGGLGGDGNDGDKVLVLERTGTAFPSNLLELVGIVAGDAPEVGTYVVEWQSVVASGTFGGAVFVTPPSGEFLASLEYEPDNIFFFNGEELPGTGWVENEPQQFAMVVNLDDRTATLLIDGVEQETRDFEEEMQDPTQAPSLRGVFVDLGHPEGEPPEATFAVDNIVIDVPLATQLVFTAQPLSSVAGTVITPAVEVTLQDASGNTVTSFIGHVTVDIGANPGTGNLSGTLIRVAEAGVATFSDLSIDKAGIGYTLTASSTDLSDAISAAFDIVAGPPAILVGISGDNQTALPTSTLATDPEVRVTDVLSNPVSGVSVAFNVVAGGGAVNPSVVTTNSLGVAATAWTLGFAADTMLSAEVSGLDPVTFNAIAEISGAGTATVDGVFGATEWANAGCVAFQANIPEGGTVPAELCVMNDASDLFLSVRLTRDPDERSEVTISFDKNGSGGLDSGDDRIFADQLGNGAFVRFGDQHLVDNTDDPTCLGAFCPRPDSQQDGAAAFGRSGGQGVFEVSHPLASGDAFDMSLSAGQTVDILLGLTIFNQAQSQSSGTLVPVNALMRLRIQP
jgi:hypothetical protein